MTEFINKFTGSRMMVSDSRVEEYKAAGHILASAIKKTQESAEANTAPKKPAPKKSRTASKKKEG